MRTWRERSPRKDAAAHALRIPLLNVTHCWSRDCHVTFRPLRPFCIVCKSFDFHLLLVRADSFDSDHDSSTRRFHFKERQLTLFAPI